MSVRPLAIAVLGAGLLIPSTAAAAEGGTPSASQSARPGAGSATASAAASPAGALSGNVLAQGGRGLSLFGLESLLPKQGPATASPDARVVRTLQTGSGTFRVTVTSRGARAAVTQAGRGRISVQRTTIAAPLCDPEDPPPAAPASEEAPADFRTPCDPVAAFETDLTATPTTRTTTLTVTVPQGVSAIQLTGGLGTLASAPSAGDRASADARVDSVSFQVQPIGA